MFSYVYLYSLSLCVCCFLAIRHTHAPFCMRFIHPASDTGRQTAEDKRESVHREELKHSGRGEEEGPGSGSASAPRLFSPVAALSKALERPPALTPPPATPTAQKKSAGTAPELAQTLEKLLVSPPPQDKPPSTIAAASESPENLQASPASHKKKSPGTADLRVSTQERREAASQHTTKPEPVDQRTEPPLSE